MPPDSIGRAQGRGRQMNLQGQRASDGRWGHALLPRVGHCPGGLGTALPRRPPWREPRWVLCGSGHVRPSRRDSSRPAQPGEGSHHSQGNSLFQSSSQAKVHVILAKLCFYFLECSLSHTGQFSPLENTHRYPNPSVQGVLLTF